MKKIMLFFFLIPFFSICQIPITKKIGVLIGSNFNQNSFQGNDLKISKNEISEIGLSYLERKSRFWEVNFDLHMGFRKMYSSSQSDAILKLREIKETNLELTHQLFFIPFEFQKIKFSLGPGFSIGKVLYLHEKISFSEIYPNPLNYYEEQRKLYEQWNFGIRFSTSLAYKINEQTSLEIQTNIFSRVNIPLTEYGFGAKSILARFTIFYQLN